MPYSLNGAKSSKRQANQSGGFVLMKFFTMFKRYCPGSGIGWPLPFVFCRSCARYLRVILRQSSGYNSWNFATKSSGDDPGGRAAPTASSFSAFFKTIWPFGECFLPTGHLRWCRVYHAPGFAFLLAAGPYVPINASASLQSAACPCTARNFATNSNVQVVAVVVAAKTSSSV